MYGGGATQGSRILPLQVLYKYLNKLYVKVTDSEVEGCQSCRVFLLVSFGHVTHSGIEDAVALASARETQGGLKAASRRRVQYPCLSIPST